MRRERKKRKFPSPVKCVNYQFFKNPVHRSAPWLPKATVARSFDLILSKTICVSKLFFSFFSFFFNIPFRVAHLAFSDSSEACIFGKRLVVLEGLF